MLSTYSPSDVKSSYAWRSTKADVGSAVGDDDLPGPSNAHSPLLAEPVGWDPPAVYLCLAERKGQQNEICTSTLAAGATQTEATRSNARNAHDVSQRGTLDGVCVGCPATTSWRWGGQHPG